MMESSRPERQLVRAVIPDASNPHKHVVDKAGRYPAAMGERGTRPEELLREIGDAVVGHALSTDVMVSRRNYTGYNGRHTVNVADVRTKAIDSDRHTLADGYMWREAEGQANA